MTVGILRAWVAKGRSVEMAAKEGSSRRALVGGKKPGR
jgi:hypothetical protein